MDKRFLTVWATVSIGGSICSIGAKDPVIAAVSWAVIGLIAAIIESKLPNRK